MLNTEASIGASMVTCLRWLSSWPLASADNTPCMPWAYIEQPVVCCPPMIRSCGDRLVWPCKRRMVSGQARLSLLVAASAPFRSGSPMALWATGSKVAIVGWRGCDGGA